MVQVNADADANSQDRPNGRNPKGEAVHGGRRGSNRSVRCQPCGIGAQGRNRTTDTGIFRLLYQLAKTRFLQGKASARRPHCQRAAGSERVGALVAPSHRPRRHLVAEAGEERSRRRRRWRRRTVGVLAFGMEQPPDGLLVTMRCRSARCASVSKSRIGADRRHVSTLARVGGRISVTFVREGFEVSGPVGPLMLKGVTAQGIGVGHRRALTRTLITWRSSRQSTAS